MEINEGTITFTLPEAGWVSEYSHGVNGDLRARTERARRQFLAPHINNVDFTGLPNVSRSPHKPLSDDDSLKLQLGLRAMAAAESDFKDENGNDSHVIEVSTSPEDLTELHNKADSWRQATLRAVYEKPVRSFLASLFSSIKKGIRDQNLKEIRVTTGIVEAINQHRENN